MESRIVPLLPYGVVNHAAGLTGLRFRDMAVGTAVGAAPKVFAYVALGGSLSNLSAPEVKVARRASWWSWAWSAWWWPGGAWPTRPAPRPPERRPAASATRSLTSTAAASTGGASAARTHAEVASVPTVSPCTTASAQKTGITRWALRQRAGPIRPRT